MADAPNKLLYIVVVDQEDEEKRDGDRNVSLSSSSPSLTFRYTRSLLQSTLQFMGCKAGHAFKISRSVFEMTRSECSASTAHHMETERLKPITLGRSNKENDDCSTNCLVQQEGPLTLENLERNNSRLFDLYKRLTTVFVLRENFLNVVCHALSQYKYVGPNQRADFALACRLREKKESVTILLCGTSGCGKSTLSALLGSRLGITTVISTDSIRHMMRSFVDETQNPLLWSSTYHAGEHLDPVAVTEAKARRKANKLAGVSHLELSDRISNLKSKNEVPEKFLNKELVGQRQMAIEGFKAQSEMVIDSLDRLITAWEERKESVIVEGVHLSLNFVMGLMKKHPSIIPFMIYIYNEGKHMERFAVRAKYMTLEPSKNRYVKYIRNIRAIQEYLCNRADKYLVPKINNTNVDKSVAAIHATVFSCLRKRWAGEQLYDPTTNTIPLVNEAYRNQLAANSLSSKGMFQLIQSKGSSRNLMALLNSDGSVAKAWHVESGQVIWNSMIGTESDKNTGTPTYGLFQIRKAEPVNLQFGNFGISAWSSETGGTSQTGSVDELRPDGTDTGSKCFSSCCSSPGMSDGLSKEVKEGSSVSGSDEEAEDAHEADSDEDASDLDDIKIHEEMEGSVDEDSAKSDEEYENLVMQDGLDNGYCSDEDEPYREKKLTAAAADIGQNGEIGGPDGRENLEKYPQNFDVFLKVGEQRLESPCSYFSSVPSDKNLKNVEERIKRRLPANAARFHGRSRSFPTGLKKEETILTDAIVSGAPRK